MDHVLHIDLVPGLTGIGLAKLGMGKRGEKKD
jgi:hypothetical protein